MDPFDFALSQDLGMSLAGVRALSNAEVTEWRAFYVWRHAQQELEADVAEKRARGTG